MLHSGLGCPGPLLQLSSRSHMLSDFSLLNVDDLSRFTMVDSANKDQLLHSQISRGSLMIITPSALFEELYVLLVAKETAINKQIKCDEAFAQPTALLVQLNFSRNQNFNTNCGRG
ncbi:unnamed protein product [Citrullus colocynthis]|uniref:Uncharacterized protein n=1 Tax=Citrullus colocynthis TaxID=252529 RepID=A0ABP0ZB25_9ROSI